MTLTAFWQGRDMVWLLALGNNTVMAGCAVLVNVQMIETRHLKGDKVVRVVALRAVPDGHHVIRALTLADRVVVAGSTAAGNTLVAETRPFKGGRVVTVRATLVVRIGRYVTVELADADYVVVAGGAGKRAVIEVCSAMVKDTRGKGPRGVTLTTIRAGWHVIGRLGESLAINRMTRVAPYTCHFATGMVNKWVGKTADIMAGGTI